MQHSEELRPLTGSVCVDSFTDPLKGKNECLQEVGDTVISKHLNPLTRLNLTVYLKGGQKVTTAMEMKKIGNSLKGPGH